MGGEVNICISNSNNFLGDADPASLENHLEVGAAEAKVTFLIKFIFKRKRLVNRLEERVPCSLLCS